MKKFLIRQNVLPANRFTNSIIPAESRVDQKNRLTRISHRVRLRGGGDASLTRLATEAPAGVLDGTSRRPIEHNAVRPDVYATAVVSW